MYFLRSLVFNILFFGWGLLSAVLFMPFFLISTSATQMMARPWAAVGLWLAKIVCGIRYEVRGQQYIVPRGKDNAVIYASKHQSAWDTMIFHQLSYCPAYVLKRELLFMPLWGWYLWRMKMIAIDRSAKTSSMKHLIKQAKSVLAEPRSITIFPEGTRTLPDADPVYHPGIIALYSQLKVPVVPVALNSGLYWPRNSFVKKPGKIIIEFLPPIAPGLPKDEFMAKLKETIETATSKLIAEGRQTQ
jgi:1-acyl-sn-glycerol-3-phosphate acyltransferase